MIRKGFTLVELIVVIIIVGILASIALTQYANMVEYGRVAEAKTRLGSMRQAVYEYYWTNGSVESMQNSDVGVSDTCSSDSYYRYRIFFSVPTIAQLWARRCTSGGKTPDSSSGYSIWYEVSPSDGYQRWHCQRGSPLSGCFGMNQ
ncbi:MAG: prepilin-type N-terminal cleavage/methylation domain-containing protein [Candidatus Omnitrophica bacterium]|nr:prepilin-type N-terminal cleavage/methylation domain-containing protein [Candidatus Omnitrophota bacterium]